MKKSLYISQRKIADIYEFESLLLDLNIDPDQEEYSDEEISRIDAERNQNAGSKQPLPASNGNNNGYIEKSLAITPTDDDILEIAASTGVDLDVVMSAAAHVENLEALVRWVEEYKKLEDGQRIKDSAKQQFELDQLREKEQELGERLNAAIDKPAVNVSTIRQRLGVKVPQCVTNLGKWDGKSGSEKEPDFLKKARAAMTWK